MKALDFGKAARQPIRPDALEVGIAPSAAAAPFEMRQLENHQAVSSGSTSRAGAAISRV